MAAKRKIILTDPQLAFLRELPTYAVENYKPAIQLVELGFATKTDPGSHPLRRKDMYQWLFETTEAGTAYLQALDMADRTCSRCKTAPFTCRVCGRKTCEHFCRFKTVDGTALCGRAGCIK